ncbi:unnamed protein product, partial [Mesorhabditis spiculigera]
MHFHDDSLFPETQDKLSSPLLPTDRSGSRTILQKTSRCRWTSMSQQAVDCFNAGATVLHIHVRELDGKGSKRLSKFNELLGRLREAVPEMILQVGGSISFAPEGEGADAKWLSDDVTIAINTSQMNIMELMTDDDIAGTSMQRPELADTYREMTVPAGPSGGRAPAPLSSIPQLETVERLIRRGIYTGPVNLTWVAIGGGFDGPNPYNMMNSSSVFPTRPAGEHDGHRDGLARSLRQRGHHLGPQGREDDVSAARSGSWCALQASGAQVANREGSSGTSTGSVRRMPTPTRRWRSWVTRPTAGSASWDSRSTPEFAPLVQQFGGTNRDELCSPNPRLHLVLLGEVMGLQAPATPRVDTALGIGGRRGCTRGSFSPWLSVFCSRTTCRGRCSSAVFPDPESGLGLSDSHLASLSSVVALMVGLLTFPLSLLADRWGRVKSLILMAVLWSVATLLCAIAQTYEQMLGARFLVGVGEAAYGSVGIAVVPKCVCAPRALSSCRYLHGGGGSFGSVVGVAIGGFIAVQFSWRWSFAAPWRSSDLILVALFRTPRHRDTAHLAPSGRAGCRRGSVETHDGFRAPGVLAVHQSPPCCSPTSVVVSVFTAAVLLAWLP